MNRQHVLLLLPNLASGGAERTTLNLQRFLDPAQFDVTVGILDVSGEYLEQLGKERWAAPSDSLRALAARCPRDSILRGVLQIPPLVSLVRKHQPDVVMSSMADVTILLSFAWKFMPGLRRKTLWIAREGNHTHAVLEEAFPNRFMRRAITHLLSRSYAAADLVVAPSRGVADELVSQFGITREKTAVIGNPLDHMTIATVARNMPSISLPERYVVGVGRLQPQKGFDVLLRAIATLDDKNVGLVIIGEGPERETLSRLAGQLGIGDRVHFPGFLANPWSVIARSELFCLSSRWEGFGHVITEAMACETPIVVTGCPHGPAEIVRDGIDGLVVQPDDWMALSNGIQTVLGNPDQARQRVGSARMRASDFHAEKIAQSYASAFGQVPISD